jgi:hypothetical protein
LGGNRICFYIAKTYFYCMVRDKRYNAAQSLMEGKRIQRFKDIFEYIPKSIVARDLSLNYRSFISKVNAPNRFTVKDIARMADLIEVPYVQLFEIIIADLPAKNSA